ncbi:MAG: hypothetical protein GY842_22905, partial [bacterium]|nr:hypothetical protein [bacterium]
MLDAYPDTFTFVQTHLDAYTIPWGSTRAGFYGIAYTPTTWFDGVIERVSPYSFAIYQSFYNTRRAVPTDVTIELSGELVGWRNIRMRADVCVEAGGVAKTMRVHMVQVLDNWPIPPTYSRNGLKQAADYQDVFVSPGQCQEVENVFAFDSDSWSNRDDIQIIAWAQETDASGPAEVHQAAFKRWPLAAVKGDFDDDTRVNLDDYPDFADCLAGPGTAPSPTLP